MKKHLMVSYLALGLTAGACALNDTSGAEEAIGGAESELASSPALLLDSNSWDYSPS